MPVSCPSSRNAVEADFWQRYQQTLDSTRMNSTEGREYIRIRISNMSVVHPQEVFQRAILAGAISIIIAHNHPSGVLTPSDEDHKVTQRLKDAGEILGIKLLDHLVLTDAAHTSII